jgi:DNA modification methylase
MTTTHEFDAYCDTQNIEDPPYHEQIALMHEYDEQCDKIAKCNGALDALVALRSRLVFFLNAYEEYYRNDVNVSHYSALLSYQTAIETLDCEVEKHQRGLAFAKGGVA